MQHSGICGSCDLDQRHLSPTGGLKWIARSYMGFTEQKEVSCLIVWSQQESAIVSDRVFGYLYLGNSSAGLFMSLSSLLSLWWNTGACVLFCVWNVHYVCDMRRWQSCVCVSVHLHAFVCTYNLVHKYLDSDSIFVVLSRYSQTLELKWNNSIYTL